LPRFIHNISDLIRRVLFLARPYGRTKLGLVFSLSLAQALFQVIGITSIFPFLAIAVSRDMAGCRPLPAGNITPGAL
jgi:hypothetical protein